TTFTVLGGISVAHLMNDMIQSILLAIYPLLQVTFQLSFAQIGLITLCYQLAASLLQPWIGHYTDRRPLPFSLVVGMGFTLLGLLLLSVAPGFYYLLLAAVLVGTGSSIFHPEASRVARMASGSRHGLAQSLFQVGGNTGSALGPLLAALVIIPHGQSSVAWFSLAALVAMAVLWRVGRWYRDHRIALAAATAGRKARTASGVMLEGAGVWGALGILGLLILSKYFYLSSLNNYFTFYLIERFGLTIPAAQLYLFLFLAAVAVGTLAGGPIGDRVGRKIVIWVSILGVAPFTLLLPHANLWWTGVLVVIIGVVLASAFSAIVVYAQELVPGRVGMISGLFFGLAFGIAGVGAAVLGRVADITSIEFVYQLCAYLPLLGLVAWWLPNVERSSG
ncbi:MAG: MFS transporter, partial [Halomonadaceae bacterium]|nr:MFS transporter [Halomonadaceae bacterium]